MNLFKQIKNEDGVSLVESITAVMIISFSVMGLVSAFIYGRFNVESAGIERKALELVNGQMDYWRNIRELTNESMPLPMKAGLQPSQTVVVDSRKELSGNLISEISPVKKDGSLSFQEVSVKLIYKNGLFKDSIGLSSKMYLR